MNDKCCTEVVSKQDEAIYDYLLWMKNNGYALSTRYLHMRILKHFSSFVRRNAIPWSITFTAPTLRAFQKEVKLTRISAPVRGLARYLFRQERISQPLQKQSQLPHIYEEYLCYFSKSRQVNPVYLQRIRRVLSKWQDWLIPRKIELLAIGIEEVDRFLAAYNPRFAPRTRQSNRSVMRGFLRYLYQESKISRDLAPLLIGAPLYAQAKPPRFLRPQEVQQLFNNFNPASASSTELRTYAILHLGYFLGLRPKEISLVSLDDISFSRREISLPVRKSNNPIKLPLPDAAIKAVAAYIIGARPKSGQRFLFLNMQKPYTPITPAQVCRDIKNWMLKANLSSTAYWLRHTYAQNLLEANASIFEVKQMLGHDEIQTTRNYIHIHTSMMREVLFNETI